MSNKAIIDKRIPLWAIPLRKIYRVLSSFLPRTNLLKQVERNGMKYLVWSGEDIGKKLLYLRKFEPDETSIFNLIIKPGDTCLDVGGNIGYYSLNFAKACEVDGKVYTFEPVERNILVIKLSILLNKFSNIEVVSAAVSDADGEVSLIVPEGDSAYAYIAQSMDANSSCVNSITLDNFVDIKNIKKVAVLKVDVEGAEMKVLTGASKLLSDQAKCPNVVMVELANYFLNRFQSSVGQVVDYMASFGYKPYYAYSNSKLRPYLTSDIDLIFNVFFIKNTYLYSEIIDEL